MGRICVHSSNSDERLFCRIIIDKPCFVFGHSTQNFLKQHSCVIVIWNKWSHDKSKDSKLFKSLCGLIQILVEHYTPLKGPWSMKILITINCHGYDIMNHMMHNLCLLQNNHEIPRGRGVSKAKLFKESMKLNWKFLGGGGIQTKKAFLGGGMDIFWNHTIQD